MDCTRDTTRRARRLFGATLLIGSLLVANNVQAEAKTWDGGGADTDWSTAANWNGDTVPLAGDDVTFGDLTTESEEAVNIDVDVVVNSITFASGFDNTSASPTAATVTIAAGKRVFVRGDFTMATGSNVKLSAADRLTVTGNVTIQAGKLIDTAGTLALISTGTATHAFGDAVFNDVLVAGPSGPVTTDLVGHWKLDESSATTAADSSGNSTNLTVVTGTSAQSGSAEVLFTNPYARGFVSGSNHAVSIASTPAHLKPATWTISAWIRPESIDTAGSDAVNNSNDFALGINTDSTARVEMRNGAGTWATCMSTGTVTLNDAWHHIVGINDGNNLTIYLNGIRKDCANYTGSQQYDATEPGFFIGRHPTLTTYSFNGRIDDVRMYDTVLSDADVQLLWAGAGVSGGSANHTAGSALVAIGDLTVDSDGTLTLANRLFVNGALTVNGTLNAAAGFPMFVQNITKGGSGAFNQGTGTVVFGSTSNQTVSHTSFGGVQFGDGNLVAHFKLDEGTGLSTADSSGNGATGTLTNGPVWNTSGLATEMDFVNTAGLTFDGSDDHVSFPVNFSHPSPITISAWINRTGNGETFPRLVILPGARFYLGHDVDTGTGARDNLGFLQDCEGNDGNWQLGTTFTRSVWHHVAVTYDGSSTSNNPVFYLDGVLQADMDERNAPNTTCAFSSGTGYIGGNGTANNYLGHIDDVRIYNAILTQAQITALAAGGPAARGSTFTLGGATTTVTGDLVINGGSLVQGSNAISLAGSWLNHSGGYSGTGTVTLNGTTAGRQIRSSGQRFAALTVNGMNGVWNLLDALNVDGALTLSNGTVDTDSYRVRAGTISRSSGTFTADSGTVVIDSASNQTFTLGTAANNVRFEDPTETNLVAYWKFDDVPGTTTRDWSVTGNTATLVNDVTRLTSDLAPVAFDNVGALSFDATDDYLTAGTTSFPAPNAAHSVSVWMKHPSLGVSRTILEYVDGSTNGNRLGVGVGGTQIQVFQDWTANVQIVGVDAMTYGLDQWIHVAYTYDQTTHRLYVNGTEVDTSTIAAPSGAITSVRIGNRNTNAEYYNGNIDDLRVYNVALSPDQVKRLARGHYPGTGGTATYTLGASLTANGAVGIDSGTLAPSSYDVTASGGLAVTSAATLSFDSTAPDVSLGSGTTLAIDGTLVSTSGSSAGPIFKSVSGTYTFSVGTSDSAKPVLNIDGLAVQNTDTNGMFINQTSGATTTFTKFNNLAFSAGSGNYLLQIAHNTLTLHANGLSFNTTGTNATYNVKLTDRNATGNDVRLYIGGTCAPSEDDCEAHDSDDDTAGVLGTSSDGVPDDAGTDGAVIQWLYRSYSDVGGTVESFPTVAFNWNTFAFHGTYVLTNNTATGDLLVKRDTDGAAFHASATWALPSGEDFKGRPVPVHDTAGDLYYVFVLSTAGRVYKLRDDGNSFTQLATFRDGASATGTSPLAADTTHLYWTGASGTGVASAFKLPQSTLTGVASVAVNAATATPSLTTLSGTKYLFTAASTRAYKINTDFSPASSTVLTNTTVYGRVTVIAGNVHFVDDSGKLWALDASSMSQVWVYQDTGSHGGSCTSGGNCEARNFFYDYATGRVYYGDKDGHVYAVARNGAGGQLMWASPFATGSNVFVNSPLYRAGVIAIGSTGGKVYFIDQRSTSATAPSAVAALIRTYSFGSSASINTISYDGDGGQYVVATSDGKLYYVPNSLVADPTSSWTQ